MRAGLLVGVTRQLWPLSGGRISHCSSGRSFGSVVEDVQAAAAGRDDVGNEFGALGANVAQRAAVRVQVGELLLHRAAGQAAQRPAEGEQRRKLLVFRRGIIHV